MEYTWQLCAKPETLKPYIEEAERVGKIPWSCSMFIDENLCRHFNYKLQVESYEETMKRRENEGKTKDG